MLQFNPNEAGATMRQQMTQDVRMQPVWDSQINGPREVPYADFVQDQRGEKKYRAIDQQSETGWNSAGRFYDPKNPLRSRTAPMWEGANQGGTQVTQNAIPEAIGGTLAAGGATQAQSEAVTNAQGLGTPPDKLDPNAQMQQRNIDEGIVNRMIPKTTNVHDANQDITLQDPTQALSTLADQYQRQKLAWRNNRPAAVAQAYADLKAQGRVDRAQPQHNGFQPKRSRLGDGARRGKPRCCRSDEREGQKRTALARENSAPGTGTRGTSWAVRGFGVYGCARPGRSGCA